MSDLTVGQMMAQDGIVYCRDKENAIIARIPEYMEKAGFTKKDIRYYFNYNEDFIPDVLNDIPGPRV